MSGAASLNGVLNLNLIDAFIRKSMKHCMKREIEHSRRSADARALLGAAGEQEAGSPVLRWQPRAGLACSLFRRRSPFTAHFGSAPRRSASGRSKAVFLLLACCARKNGVAGRAAMSQLA